MTKKAKKTADSTTEVELEQTISLDDASDDQQARIDELTADLQRLQAEFSNYKRREEEVKADLFDLAKREVVIKLLPLLDNIERALAHRPAALADDAWAMGVEHVGKQTADVLKKLGVERIETIGQPFDHNLHEAIGYMMYDTGSPELRGDAEEVVAEELQAGYKMGGKVIRHAMVKVGRQ